MPQLFVDLPSPIQTPQSHSPLSKSAALPPPSDRFWQMKGSMAESRLSPAQSVHSSELAMWVVRKRKDNMPRRSPRTAELDDCSPENRRITLDVYGMYLKTPRVLLYKPALFKPKKRVVTNGIMRAQFRESKRLNADDPDASHVIKNYH